MFNLSEEITKLLEMGNIKSVLDLGAGRGEWSLLCANAGAKIVAVDNESIPLWQFDQELLKNKNISYISQNIEEYVVENKQSFDLVLLINVIGFIKKNVLLNDILHKIIEKIHSNGYLVLSFFFDDDPTMQGPRMNFYKVSDFESLKDRFEFIKEIDIWSDDLHKPHGAHKHHIGYLILKKR